MASEDAELAALEAEIADEHDADDDEDVELGDDTDDAMTQAHILAATRAAASLIHGDDHDEHVDHDEDDVSDMAVDGDLNALISELHAERPADDDRDDDGVEYDDVERTLAELEQKERDRISSEQSTFAAAHASAAAEAKTAELAVIARMEVEPLLASPPPQPPLSPRIDMSATLESLNDQLDATKRKAVELKRAGRLSDAVETMKTIKILRHRIQQTATAMQRHNDAQSPLSAVPPLPPVQRRTSSGSSSANNVERALQQRLNEYKVAAVTHRRARRLDNARVLLLEIQRVKLVIDECAQGKRVITSNDIPLPLDNGGNPSKKAQPPPLPPMIPPTPPPRPPRPALPLQPPHRAMSTYPQTVSSSSSAAPSYPQTSPQSSYPPTVAAGYTRNVKERLQYDDVIHKLRAQIDELNTEMSNVIKADATSDRNKAQSGSVSAASKTAKLLALQYHRQKKRSQSDLDLILAAQARQLPPPTYHSETVEVSVEHRNDDVHDDHLQVIVHSLQLAAADYLPFVTVSFEGNPGVTHTTPTKKGAMNVFDYVCAFHIGARKDRRTRKSVERSRIVFAVFHSRWILGATELGRAELKLKELSTLAEKTEILRIRSGNERVGDLKVTVKLRRPLDALDIRKVNKEYVVVDEFYEREHNDAHSPIMTVSEPAPPTTEAVNTSAPPLPDGVTEYDVGHPHDLTAIFSNDVLDWELNEFIPQQIAAAKSKGESFDEWSDRQRAAQTQMDILVNAVQSGKLSLSAYLSRLATLIDHQQALAKALLMRHKKADAILVLRRIKIMKNEREQAEANKDSLQEQ